MTPNLPYSQLSIDGGTLTVDDVDAVASRRVAHVALSETSLRAMKASVTLKDELVGAGQAIYGVTTGFGDSVIRQIEPAKAIELQRNLIRYHVNGTGPSADPTVVRATLLIRANCLAKGNSAIRPEVVERLLAYLTHDLLPNIPERGSVGASGDLVPLCHLAVTLLGEGKMRRPSGAVVSASECLASVGLDPLVLQAKEGLALINGTSFSSAFAALATQHAARLATLAELCTAMAAEALLGNRGHFHPFIHGAKPHPGQLTSARTVHGMLENSQLAMDHSQVLALNDAARGHSYAEHARSIQDRYSLRCAPHVIGVLRDVLSWTRTWVEIEINSSNDNPLFEVDARDVHSGGNFYGGHIAQAMDSLKIAVASVADLMDRQLAHVVDEKFNRGLTPNLIPPYRPDEWRAGLHHGFKGMQLAASAITAEALRNTTAATIFSRSTEAHNQDKVSMSAMAARDARTVVALTEEVCAILLLALCQALDLRGIDKTAATSRRIHALIRAHVPTLEDDRSMEEDIQRVLGLIRENQITDALAD